MYRILVTIIAAIFSLSLFGCPVPVVKSPPPGHIKAKPKPVPPGQVRRQQTPSGPKPIPPGQMKKRGPDVVVVAPPLPPVVEIDIDTYFPFEGFYYFFVDGVWFYADSPGGHRVKLPKSHYPKEVKHKKGKWKDKDHGKDKDKKKGRGR